MKFSGRLARHSQFQIQALSVLLVLYHLGGKETAGRVLEYLEKIFERAVEPQDIEPEYRGNWVAFEHRWYHYIHSILAQPSNGLRVQGYILPPEESGRGIWALSDKGHLRIERLLKEGRDPESNIHLSDLTADLNIPFLKGQQVAPPPPDEAPLVLTRRGRSPRNGGSESTASSRQHQILDEEIVSIREFLAGNDAHQIDDEKLCEWISFCYTFELYAEGAALFPHIHPEFVERHLYERAKRIAEICTMRQE